MLKKTITYEDYDGNQRSEDFYFNISKAELTEYELTTPGGLETLLSTVISSKDGKLIIDVFKYIIRLSYGVKSPDGRMLDKSEEAFKQFSQTEAYSELFMELATNADAASAFISGIMPKGYTVDTNKIPSEKLLNASPSQIVDMLHEVKNT